MEKNFKEAEDLLTNESFLSWYFKTNNEDVESWETFIRENPDKTETIEEAARLLELIRLTDIPLPSLEMEAGENRLLKSINGQKDVVIPVHRNRMRIIVAATFVLVLLAINEFKNHFDTPAFHTRYGEIKQEKLPDGSLVTLNSNTEVRISRDWVNDNDHQVWVRGEAFFEVQKRSQKQRFIIHTAGFDIIITGTRFSVKNRNDKTGAFLKNGSLLIRPNNFYNYKEINMQPGDFVQFRNELIQKKTVTDHRYIAWMERKIVFENATAEDVEAFVKEYYGVRVRIKSNGSSQKKVSGTFPNTSLDAFLQSIEATSRFLVVKSRY